MRLSSCAPLTNAEGLRSYCVQYRETDLAFVQRLLAEEGLAWRVQPDAVAPLGHSLFIFPDNAQAASCPEDSTSRDGARARTKQTPHGVGSAFWYWLVSRSLDAYGEADDFIWLTISVNGGLNGYDHRLRVANAGIRVLGIQNCAVKNG